ncbi:MAG: hypothetical protein ABJO09_01065 [Hyphomicrobiales bacterium]
MADPVVPEVISIKKAASMLMIGEERVRQLIKDGYIERAGRGKVPLVSAVQGYINFRNADDRQSTKSAAESRLRDVRSREIEIRSAEREGRLIDKEETLGFISEFLGRIRNTLAGMPARVSQNIEERRRIEDVLDRVMAEIADDCEKTAFALAAGDTTIQTEQEADTG